MSNSLPHILFLEKTFLRPPPEPLRGVELFNLQLVAEMLALGFRLTILMQEQWRPIAEQNFQSGSIDIIWKKSRWQPISWGLRQGLRQRKFDVLFLANVGNGLIPLMHALRWTGVVNKAVLIAHREATPRFVRALQPWQSWIVAVNEQIARPFRARDFQHVVVDYGVMGADRYFPTPRPVDSPVRFLVLGVLDNAWKGADTAIEAYCNLKPEVRARCELHLASYINPPAETSPGVIVHAWKSANEIPGFLREMDVMICPSRDEHVMRETFSQAMVQGMLTGLPIIAHDLPILRSKIDTGGGRVFRSTEELTTIMEEMVGDTGLRARLGTEGRATALKRYQWNTARFTERYILHIYHENDLAQTSIIERRFHVNQDIIDFHNLRCRILMFIKHRLKIR